MNELRLLGDTDAAPLETFLASHRDSSMFLRANARRGGLEYEGKPFQATYVAACQGEKIVAVAAHCWNGMLLLQAPEDAASVAEACVRLSGRPVAGFAGPSGHVERARAVLGLSEAPAAIDSGEQMYALDLAQFLVPASLAAVVRSCRPPRAAERDLLCAWRRAYDVEVLGGLDSEAERQRSADFLDSQIAAGNAWVAIQDDTPVSLSAFNATLPDMVQLGGIYTPPALRGRGYARAAVAAALVAARERGATRAVLFTSSPSAVRCYEALGFRCIGDYSLVILR